MPVAARASRMLSVTELSPWQEREEKLVGMNCGISSSLRREKREEAQLVKRQGLRGKQESVLKEKCTTSLLDTESEITRLQLTEGKGNSHWGQNGMRECMGACSKTSWGAFALADQPECFNQGSGRVSDEDKPDKSDAAAESG